MEKKQLYSKVSRRYGKALFSISIEQSVEKKIYNEVNSLLDILNSDKRFYKLFESPLLSSKSQETLVGNIFSIKDSSKIKLSKTLYSFLIVLATNRRLKAMLGALHSFKELIIDMHKEVNVSLKSAVILDKDTISSLTKILSSKTDKKVNIITSIDKSIIGGIVVQHGSNMIDASISNKISKIKNVIKGASQ